MSLTEFWILIIIAVFVAPFVLELAWSLFIAALAFGVAVVDSIRGARRR